MGNLKRAVVGMFGGVLTLAMAVHAETGPTGHPSESRGPSVRQLDSSQIASPPAVRPSTLKVQRVRLEATLPPIPTPSVVLKFDLVNDGLVTVSGVILEVAIRERLSTDADPHVVAGPFTIRGDVDLQAGYTLNYEMLLRNLPSDCDCVADVAIVERRAAAPPAATTSR